MAFDGRDYQLQFEEACKELRHTDEDMETRSSLEGIEWVLWEAIRGVFLYAAIIPPLLILILLEYSFKLSEEMGSFMSLAFWLAFIISIALAIYWFLRFLFWYEISRYVKGRKFGDGGLN